MRLWEILCLDETTDPAKKQAAASKRNQRDAERRQKIAIRIQQVRKRAGERVLELQRRLYKP